MKKSPILYHFDNFIFKIYGHKAVTYLWAGAECAWDRAVCGWAGAVILPGRGCFGRAGVVLGRSCIVGGQGL